MKELILASNNKHKIEEINLLFNHSGLNIKVLSLDEIGFTEEILEIGRTLEENSLIKAYYVFMRTRRSVFADDSGLLVNSLNGAPGVHSARYASDIKDDKKNNEKLLKELKGKVDRNAQFMTVITFITEKGSLNQFSGFVSGKIALSLKGKSEFGYDPLFIPDGYSESFAELGIEIKNTISHRKQAVERLIAFLKTT